MPYPHNSYTPTRYEVWESRIVGTFLLFMLLGLFTYMGLNIANSGHPHQTVEAGSQ